MHVNFPSTLPGLDESIKFVCFWQLGIDAAVFGEVKNVYLGAWWSAILIFISAGYTLVATTRYV